MTDAEKDLSILHDCQEILERHISDARTEIRAKLECLRTEDGNALFAEFDSCLMDHIHDVENDTLDAWAITKKSEIEGGEWDRG